MTTLADLPRQYAGEVRAAIDADRQANSGYVKTAADASTVAKALPTSNLIRVLKKIAREVEQEWRVNDRPLSDDQKSELYRETGRLLGVPRPSDFELITKGASNDAYMTLVNHIGGLLPRPASPPPPPPPSGGNRR